MSNHGHAPERLFASDGWILAVKADHDHLIELVPLWLSRALCPQAVGFAICTETKQWQSGLETFVDAMTQGAGSESVFNF